MNKILVCLEVPVIDEQFDIYLPDFLKISELIFLISKAFEELSHNRYVSSGEEYLNNEKGTLNTDLTLRDYGIQNGDHLILI